jgi:hypothetical protein
VYDVLGRFIWFVCSRYGKFHCRSSIAEDAAPKAMTVTVVSRIRDWRRGMHILSQPVQGAVSICMS